MADYNSVHSGQDIDNAITKVKNSSANWDGAVTTAGNALSVAQSAASAASGAQSTAEAAGTAAANAASAASAAQQTAAAALPKAGGTMTGAVDMGGNKITNVGAPSASTDIVRKQELDLKAPIASPTFTGTPKAPTGTDYGISRIRNISAGTTDLEAGVSTLASGELYFVYE